MTSEQLLATRATLWRQRASPLLTLEDAQSWLLQSGLCLFLPRKAQIPAPAPSFVEACLGETNATPPRAAIEPAKELLARLIEANEAIALNLLGTPVDHPDFVVTKEALPFVYALRGDRDWKHAPGSAGNRVSPLVNHIWKVLERRGVSTAAEIQEELGRELTEAAVVRALHELWASLRVVPLYQSGEQETLWEPLQSRYQQAIVSGVGMSQVSALSVLVSVYLQSVVAASSDDAESFLSPLASRSKIREVVRGLTATRQVALIQMEVQSLLYVEGSLPEFPEEERSNAAGGDAKTLARRPHPTSPEGMQAALKRSVTRAAGQAAPRPPYKRPAVAPAEGFSRSTPPRVRANSRGAEDRPDARRRDAGTGFRSGAGRSGAPSSGSRPIQRSEPGSGLRADGSPKKPRWRDMPGGRPDQKGKPARFSAPRPNPPLHDVPPRPGTEESARPARRGNDRKGAEGNSALRTPREGQPFRPAAGGRPGGGAKRLGSGGTSRPGRSSYGAPGGGGGRRFSASGSPGLSSAGAGGSRPPSRTGADRSAPRSFSPRPAGGRTGSLAGRTDRPAREGGASASGGDRKFTPRPQRSGGFSAARPSPGEGRPSSTRGASSAGGRPPSKGRPTMGRPSFGKKYSSPGGRPTEGAGSDRPARTKSFGARGFGERDSQGPRRSGPRKTMGNRPSAIGAKGSQGARSGARQGSRLEPRPGTGQGARQGSSDRSNQGPRKGPTQGRGQGSGRTGTGRPRTGPSAKPAGRGRERVSKPRSGPQSE